MSSRKRKWDSEDVEVDPSKRRRSESYFQSGSPSRHNFHRDDRFPGKQSHKYELFFGWRSPFSQHHPAKFTVDGKTFNCAEQYYMYRKAALFEDKDIEEKIMNSQDPKEQKRLGKQIQNFDFDTWMQHSQKVVEKGNMAKFSQNPHLKKRLFATAPRLMVEASPHDATWGIALHRNDPRAWDERTWQGQNLLGQIITKVRDNLMRQDGVVIDEGGSIEEAEYSFTMNSPDGYQWISNDGISSRKRKWDGEYVEFDSSKRRRSEGHFQAGSPSRHNFHRGCRFPGKQSQKYELFFGWRSPFSQHHPAKFTVDGKKFNCAEQYYMYRKAALFEDKDIEEKVMNSQDPKEQKRLGKQVRNFDFDTWMQHSQEVVEKGNMAKFSQNPHLKKKLFATAPRLMVEASPHDATWGIALHRNDPRAWDERTWQGQNLLGQIITKVRDNLMRQDGVLVGEDGGSMERTDYSSTADSSDGYHRTIKDMDRRIVSCQDFSKGRSFGQRTSSSGHLDDPGQRSQNMDSDYSGRERTHGHKKKEKKKKKKRNNKSKHLSTQDRPSNMDIEKHETDYRGHYSRGDNERGRYDRGKTNRRVCLT